MKIDVGDITLAQLYKIYKIIYGKHAKEQWNEYWTDVQFIKEYELGCIRVR